MKIHRSPSLTVIGPFRIVQTARYAMHLSTCANSAVYHKHRYEKYNHKTKSNQSNFQIPGYNNYDSMPTLDTFIPTSFYHGNIAQQLSSITVLSQRLKQLN